MEVLKYIVIAIFLSGCSITLQIDKPIVLENRFPNQDILYKYNEELANSFNDKRKVIFKSLVQLSEKSQDNSTTWHNWLIMYGKDDIDGFIEWCKNDILKDFSGGNWLNNFFNKVKEFYKNEENNER